MNETQPSRSQQQVVSRLLAVNSILRSAMYDIIELESGPHTATVVAVVAENALTNSAMDEREETDAKFISAGHKPEDRTCDHAAYTALKEPRPRHCPKCGTCMWDAGD